MWVLERQYLPDGDLWRERGRAVLGWGRAHWRALGASLLAHLLLLVVVQLELAREKPRVVTAPEIPIELVVLPALPPASEAPVEEEVPGTQPEAEVETPRDVNEPQRQRPLPAAPGPNVAGFRRFILAIDCTPEMAATSAEMAYACRRMSEIMDDLTAEEVARLKARAAGLVYARGWALPPPEEELQQDTIRKDTEKGAPGEDVMGPMPWDVGP